MRTQSSKQSVSPIEIVPRDVLSLIFYQCLSNIHGDEETIPTTTPITLALVSKQWKDTVWSSVELWTTLSLSNVLSKDHIKSWFARAGSELPLSLRIRHSPCPETSRLDFVGLNDVLLTYADRFEHLHLTLPTRYWGALSLTNFRPTRLRSFRIFGEGALRRIIDPVDLTASPQLSDLAISNTFLRFLQVDWKALRKLTMETMLMKEALEMLSEGTGLVHLVVRNLILEHSWVAPIYDTRKAISLPHLRTLDWTERRRYGGMAPPGSWDFLGIQTPRLQTFRFVTEGQMSHDLVPWIAQHPSLSLSVLGEYRGKDEGHRWQVSHQIVVLSNEASKMFLDDPSSLPPLDAMDGQGGARWCCRHPDLLSERTSLIDVS